MTRVHAIVALAICLIASTAEAQESRSTVVLAPAAPTRWDAAAHVTWLGSQRPPRQFFQWNRWLGVVAGGGSVGYYWTSHLKTEFDLATSTEGEMYSVEVISVSGQTTPLYIERDHEIRFTTASAGMTGQFFENAWFHPFISAGIELVREREHVDTIPPPVPPRGAPINAEPLTETRLRYSGRPYVGTGFKAYLSDHAFIRTDIRTSWSRDGLAGLGWRSGVGVDF